MHRPRLKELGSLEAREHFELHKIKVDDEQFSYSGLSNTINFWYEVPYKVAYGFSLSPLIGSASKVDDKAPSLSSRVNLVSIGGEFKYFLSDTIPVFTRLGMGWSQLRSSGNLKESNGLNTYAGIGYEVPVGKLGIALELAHRNSYLQNKIQVQSWTPSIGFHFYSI